MKKVDSKSNTNQDQSILEEIDTQVQLIQSFIPLGLMAVEELLYKEVEMLAGPRYHRKEQGKFPGYRWGTNPGSVFLGGTKVKTQVPRVRAKDSNREIPLQSYERLQERHKLRKYLLGLLLGGLSTRRYSQCAQLVPEIFGISPSSLSRHFMEVTEEKLKAFTTRRLDGDYVALFIDGKTFARQQIIIALGVTMEGHKVPLGFVQGATEHHRVCLDLLKDLKYRGFTVSKGVLVIIDGSKGLRKAVALAFGSDIVVQRCQWHKRENVVSYLSKADQKDYRRKLEKAYQSDTYQEAKETLKGIARELEVKNLSAARSLREGLEETLTVLKLQLPHELTKVFRTTNCIESLNSQLGRLTGRVTRWQSSAQIHRWVACALLDIETRMRKVKGYKQLTKLRKAINEQRKLNRN